MDIHVVVQLLPIYLPQSKVVTICSRRFFRTVFHPDTQKKLMLDMHAYTSVISHDICMDISLAAGTSDLDRHTVRTHARRSLCVPGVSIGPLAQASPALTTQNGARPAGVPAIHAHPNAVRCICLVANLLLVQASTTATDHRSITDCPAG